jgi:branched-chain amino acid transport system ATP-binding protein
MPDPLVDTLLEVRGIETFYGTSQALFGVSLTVGSGDVVALMGRNGMGKTTTVHSIMGITPPRAGEIRFASQAVHNLPSYRIAQQGIGLVPEGRQVFPTLSVRENLVATAANHGKLAVPWSLAKVFELFPKLAERARQLGSTLSGGEQQMLAIGRALMTNPKLLIFDEATEGLAPLIREEIWACIARLKALGQAILVIDKNLEELAAVADRAYVMEKGRIAWEGAMAEITSDEPLRQRYLGV